jgi:hypothetical protein
MADVARFEVRRITREPMPILFERVGDNGPEIQAGFDRLERLTGLRGRRFYGVIDAAAGDYLVAVALSPDDPADRYGLELGELVGGDYLAATVRGEPPAVYAQLPVASRQLRATAPADESRHCVEFYRRHTVIEVWMPVR